MTRRDYEIIATAVREGHAQAEHEADETNREVIVAIDRAVATIVGHLALRLGDDNECFDADRFKEACLP